MGKSKEVLTLLNRDTSAEKRLKEAHQRIRFLEKVIEQQQEKSERLAKAKWAIPKSKPQAAGGSFLRLVVPDTHGSAADKQAISAMFADVAHVSGEIREVVLLGDHLDCGGFLAAHHTEHYVAETDRSFEDDVNATNEFLDTLQTTCPKAKIYYLEGNHERRIEKWCVTQSLRNQKDAAKLFRCFGAPAQLHIEKRGINYYKQGQCYDGIKVPATIKLGKGYFTHGERCGKSSAAATLSDFAACVTYGHVHREQSVSDEKISTDAIAAFCPGCLCVRQPMWAHSRPTGWTLGYGMQAVVKSGHFLNINAPIIFGQSLLSRLLR